MEREFIRVLLIEDNLGDAKFINEMINDARDFQFRLDHAFRLSSGLEFIQKKKYDIILLDLGLPDSMGLETLQEVHAAAESIPIVIMTGLDDEELGVRAVQLGAQDYIVKLQIDSYLLVRAIRYAIERKKISQKLKESESNLAEAQKLAHLGNYEMSPKGDWATGSEEAYRIIGRDPSMQLSSVEEYILQVVYPDDQERVRCEFEDVIKKKISSEFEFRIVLSGGEVRHIHNIIRPVLNQEGEIIKLFGIIMDITEQKLNQIALVESEELSRAVFEQAAVGISLVALEGRLFKVNDKFCQITGYKQEELEKLTFQEITHPDDLQKDLDFRHKLRDGEINAYSIEKRYIRKDGFYVWVNLTVSSIFSPSGELKYYLGVVEDITERKWAEEARLQSEETAHAFMSAITEAAIIMDHEGLILASNETSAKRAGKPTDRFIGTNFFDYLPEEIARDRRAKIGRMLETKLPLRFEDEMFGRIMDNIFYPIFSSKGEVTKVAFLGIDVTERKKALEQIEKYVDELQKNKSLLEENANELSVLNKKLNESNINKDKFFSILAHDLRSPFSALLGFAEFMSNHIEELTQDEIREYSQRIYKSLNNLFKLIENLLQWSRIQTGRIDYSPKVFDLQSLSVEVTDIYHVNLSQKNLRLVNNISERINVFADKDMIDSVIGNLLSNAIKFTPSGGQIRLSAEDNEKYVRFSVADTGVGMNEKTIDQLFKIEQTLSTEGTEKEKGTGLGLILCKEFVEINHGSISVKSEPGRGSEFTVTLPKA